MIAESSSRRSRISVAALRMIAERFDRIHIAPSGKRLMRLGDGFSSLIGRGGLGDDGHFRRGDRPRKSFPLRRLRKIAKRFVDHRQPVAQAFDGRRERVMRGGRFDVISAHRLRRSARRRAARPSSTSSETSSEKLARSHD